MKKEYKYINPKTCLKSVITIHTFACIAVCLYKTKDVAAMHCLEYFLYIPIYMQYKMSYLHCLCPGVFCVIIQNLGEFVCWLLLIFKCLGIFSHPHLVF